MFFILLCTLLSLTVSVQSAPRFDIVNGEVANITDFPYMVSILFDWSDYYKEFNCGASILDEKTILTAGHCAYGNERFIDRMRIGIGHTNISEVTLVNISKFYIHEDFAFEPPFKNDIAVFKLVEPLIFDDNVQPIRLPQANEYTPERKQGVITGWGMDGVSRDMPKLLHKLDVVVWDDDACENIYANVTDETFPEYSYASNRTIQLCAKYPKPVTAGVCSGDSGGPLVVDGVQYGIVSYMQLPCGNSTFPVVFTKISHYMDWILPKME